MQLIAWQKRISRTLSPVSGVFLALMILGLLLGGYHLVQWLNPGSRITPRTVGNLEEVPILIRHDAGIRSIAFNLQPNADLSFASSSGDGLIKLWQLDEGSATEKLAVQAGQRIALSPDGKLLASLDFEDGAKLWDLTRTDTLFHSLKDNQGSYALSFSPNGQILASSNADGTIKLLDWQHGKSLHTLKVSEIELSGIAFSPDGQTLAGNDGEQTIKLWNWRTGKALRTLQGDIYGGSFIVFSPGSQTLASVKTDGKTQTIMLLDWRTGQVIQTLRVASSSFNSFVAFSPDGQTLATNSDDGIKLWNWSNGTELLTIKEGMEPFAFSPDGQTLATNSDDGIKLWNWSNGRLIRNFHGREKDVILLAFSPDGQTLIGEGYEGKITLWNQQNGTERLSIKVKGVSGAFALSPDGQTLAIGSTDKGIKLFSLNPQAKLSRPLNVKLKSGRFIAFSPDQQHLILAGSREIKRLRFKDHQEVLSIQAKPIEFFIACALSSDGDILATSNFNGPIKLWNLHDGKLIRTLQTGSDSPALSLTFSRDGQMLASAFPFKNTIQVWNLKNGHLIHQWEANRVSQVVFSPNGQLLASGNGDGAVQLWNPQTSKKLRTLKGHGDGIGALAFSTDGQTLASGSDDQTIKLWRVKQ
jgi:WD40 repeat protein